MRNQIIRRDGVLTNEEILKIAISYNFDEIRRNLDYFEGENRNILRVYAEREAEGTTPNLLIPAPYAGTITETAASFSFNDISIKDTFDKGDESTASKKFIAEYKKIMSDNDSDVMETMIGENMLGIGCCYELHYLEDGKYPRFGVVPSDEGIPIFSRSIGFDLVGFIWYRYDEAENETLIDYYSDTESVKLRYDGKVTAAANTKPKEDPIRGKNAYGIVPVCVYLNSNRGRTDNAIFRKVLKLIDAVDLIESGTLNDFEKFADAYLTASMEFDPEEIAKNLKAKKIIDNLGEKGWIKYLTKDDKIDFRKWFHDLCVTQIHKHCHVFDLHDPLLVSGATSALAVRYKLQDMINNAAKYERLNRLGQYRRIRILQGAGKLPKYDTTGIEFEYGHNIPDDVISKIQAYNGADYLSSFTKAEETGHDGKIEAARIEAENGGPVDLFGNNTTDNNQDTNQA